MPKERLPSSFNQFEPSKKGQYLYFYLWDLMKCSVKKADSRQKKRAGEGDKRRGDTNKCNFFGGGAGDRREQLDSCNKRENDGLTKGT